MADFTWVPAYVLTRSAKYVTLVTEGETGKKQLRSKRTNAVFGFGLNFPRLTKSQADAMLAFFESKFGGGVWFTWTNPIDSVTYTVRFADDELKQGYWMYNRYQCSVNFEVKVT